MYKFNKRLRVACMIYLQREKLLRTLKIYKILIKFPLSPCNLLCKYDSKHCFELLQNLMICQQFTYKCTTFLPTPHHHATPTTHLLPPLHILHILHRSPLHSNHHSPLPTLLSTTYLTTSCRRFTCCLRIIR